MANKTDRPWIMRTYAGHSTAEESNKLFKMNLSKGQTGLSVAFDLPTQTGYDSDHILSQGEVGKVGVPISNLDDMNKLESIPLGLLALTILILSSFLFAFIGIFYSRKYRGSSNYLTAGRKIGTLSLTTSLVASALGAWILFGPASAATWGGIGAIIGYSLGTAFPMFFLIYLGKK